MPVVGEEICVKQEMDGPDVTMVTLAMHNVATPQQAMTPQSVQPPPTMSQIQHALQRIAPDQSVAAFAQQLQGDVNMVCTSQPYLARQAQLPRGSEQITQDYS